MRTVLRVGLVLLAILGANPGAAAGARAPASTDWTLDLSDVGHGGELAAYTQKGLTAGDGARPGWYVAPERRLGQRVNRVRAEVDADVPAGTAVSVDIRGGEAGERWTEWSPAPATLPREVERVQARVLLTPGAGAKPTVRSVRLRADRGPAAKPTEGYMTFRVYATREGLVGGRTANGYVIKPRDHFLALPSRRALSRKGGGEYSAKVCAEKTGRCEVAPVADVGPWNTTDDYWNAPRERWGDLGRGTPQAQAAYQHGYNGGKDQFGRKVGNPAGIDLADGTFWDGLGMRDNGWVTVTMQWLNWDKARGKAVTGAGSLRIRSGPSTASPIVGLVAQGAMISIDCQVAGERVVGQVGTTDRWDRIGPNQYVAHAYVATEGAAPGSC